MRHSLGYTALGVLVVFAGVVLGQSPSCYLTTTVVFGDSESILSSLSLVSNITTISSPTLTNTPPSVVLVTPSTLSASSTISASPVITGLFRITVDVPGSGKLRARDVEFVAINGSDGILVSDAEQATQFQLTNGYLKTITGLFVVTGMSNGYAHIETSSTAPVNQTWNVNSDGDLKLAGSSDFCYTTFGDVVKVFVLYADEAPPNCTVAVLGTVKSTSDSITMSTASSSPNPTTSNTSTSSSSSAPASPDSNTLGSISSVTSYSDSGNTAISSTVSSTSSSALLISSPLTSIASTTSTWSSSYVTSSLMSVSTSAPGVVSNPTSIVGPGQMSTKVSTIYSLPFSVSSISSSSSTTARSSILPSLASTSTSSLARGSSSSGGYSTSLASLASSTSMATIVFSSSILSAPAPSSSTNGAVSNTATTTAPISINSTGSISSLLSPSSSSSSSSSSSTLSTLPSPYVRNSGKRGLAYTNVTLTQLYSLNGQNSQVSWAYDYYSLPNASDNTGPVNPALTFIPLLYNDNPTLTSIWMSNVNYSIAHYHTDALFSFNEPDACYSGQSACMSINASVAAYRAYMQPFAGRVLLGAPAVTNGAPPASLTYLSYFLGNCTGCTIDFINLHWYSSPYSFRYLQSYLTQAYAIAGPQRPIYLTEFGMDSQYYRESDVASFLQNATAWLDAQSYVARYAWFGDFAQSGPAYQQGYGYLVNGQGDGLSAEGVIWNNYTGGYVPCPAGRSC